MFPCSLKLKKLEAALQDIEVFDKPKINLEQYVTPPHLGAHMLYTIQSQYGDLAGKIVADLGCGCGALSIGAALLHSSFVVGFEIDKSAIDIFHENIASFDLNNIDIVQCDVQNLSERFYKQFDTVLLNPPFGTKNNKGIDISFLEAALKLSRNSIYSLHKTSTRQYVLNYLKNQGFKAEVLAELRFDLPSTYKFHKKSSVDIEVDLYRFSL